MYSVCVACISLRNHGRYICHHAKFEGHAAADNGDRRTSRFLQPPLLTVRKGVIVLHESNCTYSELGTISNIIRSVADELLSI